jgi:hypothetical protein
MISISAQLNARAAKFDKHATGKALRPHFVAALSALDQIRAKRSAMQADKNLSDVGRAEQLREFAPTMAPAIAKARGAVSAVKDQIAQQRANLVPRVKNKSDIAAAILRSDTRNFLRDKTQAEIIRFAESDPAVMEAVFEGMPALSGLTPESRGHLQSSYLERNAAPQLAAIAAQGEAVELLETAIAAAGTELADVAGIRPELLDAWIALRAPKDADAAAAAIIGEVGVDALLQNATVLDYDARKQLMNGLLEQQTTQLKAS